MPKPAKIALNFCGMPENVDNRRPHVERRRRRDDDTLIIRFVGWLAGSSGKHQKQHATHAGERCVNRKHVTYTTTQTQNNNKKNARCVHLISVYGGGGGGCLYKVCDQSAFFFGLSLAEALNTISTQSYFIHASHRIECTLYKHTNIHTHKQTHERIDNCIGVRKPHAQSRWGCVAL